MEPPLTDRIQLNLPYHYLTLDGQPQIVLGGSIIDVESAANFPTATVVTKGVSGTVPKGQAKTAGTVKVR